MGGDETEEESYESWLSPIIRVDRTLKRAQVTIVDGVCFGGGCEWV